MAGSQLKCTVTFSKLLYFSRLRGNVSKQQTKCYTFSHLQVLGRHQKQTEDEKKHSVEWDQGHVNKSFALLLVARRLASADFATLSSDLNIHKSTESQRTLLEVLVRWSNNSGHPLRPTFPELD